MMFSKITELFASFYRIHHNHFCNKSIQFRKLDQNTDSISTIKGSVRGLSSSQLFHFWLGACSTNSHNSTIQHIWKIWRFLILHSLILRQDEAHTYVYNLLEQSSINVRYDKINIGIYTFVASGSLLVFRHVQSPRTVI